MHLYFCSLVDWAVKGSDLRPRQVLASVCMLSLPHKSQPVPNGAWSPLAVARAPGAAPRLMAQPRRQLAPGSSAFLPWLA